MTRSTVQISADNGGSTAIDELKAAFAVLKGHETETQYLLRSVAECLSTCPDLEKSHPLVSSWAVVRQEYEQLMLRSKREASKCATLISQCLTTLPVVISHEFPFEAKWSILTELMEEAKKGKVMGDEIQEKFGDLAKKIEDFSSEMKEWHSSRRLWARLWSTLRDLFLKACELILSTSTLVMNVFFNLLKDMGYCGLKNTVSILWKNSRFIHRKDLSTTMENVRYDCTDLRCRLFDVRDFWESIHKVCEELRMLCYLARTLPDSSAHQVQTLSTQHLKQVRELLDPVVTILRTYSSGRGLDL